MATEEADARPVIFAPETTVSLTCSCGCTQKWLVHRVPEGEVVDQQAPEPCIPASCPTCIEFGRPCATRAGMPVPYASVDWADVVPSRRMRYKRMKAS